MDICVGYKKLFTNKRAMAALTKRHNSTFSDYSRATFRRAEVLIALVNSTQSELELGLNVQDRVMQIDLCS